MRIIFGSIVIYTACLLAGCGKGNDTQGDVRQGSGTAQETVAWQTLRHPWGTIDIPPGFTVVRSTDKHLAVTNLSQKHPGIPYVNILLFGFPQSPLLRVVPFQKLQDDIARGSADDIEKIMQTFAGIIQNTGSFVHGYEHKRIGSKEWFIFKIDTKMRFPGLEYHSFVDNDRVKEIIIQCTSNKKESIEQFRQRVEQAIGTIVIEGS